MILLIGHTSALFAQRPSYGRNTIKLKTIKAITIEGNRDTYLGYTN
jgi:hypothetical protein